jgi:hypothetical protein
MARAPSSRTIRRLVTAVLGALAVDRRRGRRDDRRGERPGDDRRSDGRRGDTGRRAAGGAGAIRVSYRPSLDGDPDPGEVVWGWVPYEDDPTQGKDRPMVIVGHRGGRLVGVPLTSKRDERDPQVPVGTGPWDRERRDSYARVDRAIDVDAAAVRREGAILSEDRFRAVVDGLGRHHRVEIEADGRS